MVWGLYLLGTYLAVYTNQKLLSVAVLGLAMQQAGWLGHDFQHGRGGYCWWVGHATACLINAFSPTWWSHKVKPCHPATRPPCACLALPPPRHLFFMHSADCAVPCAVQHNTHHVFPNFMGVDEDIANDPIFHLWIPSKDKDVFIRKYQHLYFFPVCAFIYVSWRIQSLQFAWAHVCT
jgi:hypothetical protein